MNVQSDEADICDEVASAIAGHPGELWWQTEMRSMRNLLQGWLNSPMMSQEEVAELIEATEARVGN